MWPMSYISERSYRVYIVKEIFCSMEILRIVALGIDRLTQNAIPKQRNLNGSQLKYLKYIENNIHF